MRLTWLLVLGLGGIQTAYATDLEKVLLPVVGYS